MNQEQIEDYAFYESGLSADGCLEKLDIYAKECIIRYGRILLNMKNKNYTQDGRHPEDAISEAKTFINELQKVQEQYFSKLVLDLKITKEGEDWLFDYVYNTSDEEKYDGFDHYLQDYKKNYDDMVVTDIMYNNSLETFNSGDLGEFSPMIKMSSCEASLGTAFPSYSSDKEFEDLALDTITIEKTNNDKV
jgi:hypothetical protein